MGHQACYALVDRHPGPDQEHAGVTDTKDEEEDCVEEDLHGVVGTGDQGEKPTRGHRVLGRVGNFELCKCSVGLQLLIPRPEKEADQGHKELKSGCWRSFSWSKPRCFAYNPGPSAKVVSKADNVVGDVHGGLACLIHCHALIESSEALQGQKT